MNRSYKSFILVVLLIFTLSVFVPTLLTSDNSEPTNESLNTDVADTQEGDTKLTTLHFSPSPSQENGIYFVCGRGVDVVAYFGVSSVYYGMNGADVKLEFPGSKLILPVPEKPTGSVTNYLLGSDQSRWQTGLQDFAMLRYVDIYPGIDLVYRVDGNNLKYEFTVSPGANPDIIQMRYPESDSIIVQDRDVTISKSGFSFRDTGLLAFHEDYDKAVNCLFQSLDTNTIGFDVDHYDASKSLIIDPVLVYSTFLGGSNDDTGYSIAVEDEYVYITGSTQSDDFPMMNANDSSFNGGEDCFVLKFAQDVQSLLYSTFIGGIGGDSGYGIAVQSGYAYVVGQTSSSDFPTYNAYNSTYGGADDCFVLKLATDGQSLIYSSYLGGTNDDQGLDIAVEGSSAYVTGFTYSSNFPTASAYDSSHNGAMDCFVTKFSGDGQSVLYSTFLGHTGNDRGNGIAVDSGHAYVTGMTTSSGFPTSLAYDGTFGGVADCFLTRLATSGSILDYSTFLGDVNYDEGHDIAVDGTYVYLVGETQSPNFPTLNAYDSTHNGNSDCFVIRFTSSSLLLSYSTFLGGAAFDGGYGINVLNENAYITGETWSNDYPTADTYDVSYNGAGDSFMSRLSHSGEDLITSTYFGGADSDIGYDLALSDFYIYVVGTTGSTNFPTIDAYSSINTGATDCFVSVFGEDDDGDGLSDYEEYQIGTDPHCIDTDIDNFLDEYEVEYGSNPLDPLSYPAMPHDWYIAIYKDLDGNTTLIQQIISWLDGNHSAIETLFRYVEGNATLLLDTVNAVDGNSAQLILLAALVTHNADALSALNATDIGDIDEIREIVDMLGATIGDIDYDGLDDLDEISLGTDIQCIDSDTDNLNDAYEVKIGTDPNNADSDSDSYDDGVEILAGSDPLDPLDYPGSIPPGTVDFVVLLGIAGGAMVLIVIVVVMRKKNIRS